MGVSVSSLFYEKNGNTNITEEEKELVVKQFKDHIGSFGRRVIRKELLKKGVSVSEHKITKILKMNGLSPKYGRKKGKNVNTAESTQKYIRDNILAQLSKEERSKLEIWSIDFSEVKLGQKKYYIFGAVSINKRMCVALRLSERQCKEVAIDALNEAIRKYGKPDMIQSDRGTQFVSKEMYEFMKNNGIVHSMSRPHKPVDNCYIETFWKSLKTEIGKVEQYTKETFEMILKYYWRYYNEERPHSSLGYLSPSEYEAKRIRGETLPLATTPLSKQQSVTKN